MQSRMDSAQTLIANNSKITLTISANYGGRWYIMNSVQGWQQGSPAHTVAAMDEAALRPYLSMAYAPDRPAYPHWR